MSPEDDKTEETTDAAGTAGEAGGQPKRRRTRAKAKPPAEKAAATKAATEAVAETTEEDTPAADAPAAEKPKRTRSRAKKPAAAKTAEKAEETVDEKPAEPAKPAKTAPARKRGGAETVTAPPVVRAHAKYVRSSARKARLVCDHIRGKDVDEARAILRFAPRAVARDWEKLLESAVANAEHNHELVGDDLRVKEAFADEGPTLKRFRPRAMGRATQIRKRTSHLTITLTPKETA
jgi:ribosomal protein L22